MSPPLGPPSAVPRRVRLEDVARRVGVSVATVSRALRGGAGVRPDLRAQVIQAAKDCNYALPAAVDGQRLAVIASAAAMVDFARSQFTLNVMQGLADRAAARGLTLDTRGAATPAEAARLIGEAERDPGLAGLLLLSLDEAPLLDRAAAAKVPVVLVNGEDPLMRLSGVTPCNRAAAALATDYLLGLGHRRILFLMCGGRATIAERCEGWRARMRSATGDCDPALLVQVPDWTAEAAAEALGRRIEAGALDFSAVLAAGDSLALGAARALADRRIPVPQAVSVMGMDGLPQTAFHQPPLSVIEIPMREIGAAAVDLLCEQMQAPGRAARRVELGCRLVPRVSTGRALA